MNSSILRASLLLCCSLALTACVLINRFDKIEAIVSANEVAFTLPGSKEKQPIILRGITVWAENCEHDCVYWQLVRPVSAMDVQPQVTTLPIIYGADHADMQTRTHKPLKPGLYRVSAGLGVLRDGGGTDEIKVIGGFTIR